MGRMSSNPKNETAELQRKTFDPSDGTSAEAFKSSSKVQGYPSVFSIGPFASKVSFLSQQIRALYTVWALYNKKIIQENDNVAVIGGGISGIMAATSLVSQGCNVWLYEEKPMVLELQRQTSHRVVHPTINFWPYIDLQPTTALPFLNWYYDECSHSIKKIHEEWTKNFKDKMAEIYTNTKVTGLERDGENGLKVHAKGLFGNQFNEQEEKLSEAYKAVLITTGFGPENIANESDACPYWEPDKLDQESLTNKKFIISGTGDGGLIDTLRVLYKDFNYGRKVISIAEKFSKVKNITKSIKAIEDSVQQLKNDEAAVKLKEGYFSIINNLNAENKKIMSEGLFNEKDRVTLIGRLPQPFSKDSAPIHKLMIAFTLFKEFLIYEHHEKGVNYSKGRLISSKTGEKVKPGFHIQRHGPEAPIKKIIPDIDLEKFKNQQEALNDIYLKGWMIQETNDYFTNIFDLAKHSFSDSRYIEDNHSKMVQFLSKNIGSIHLEVCFENQGTKVVGKFYGSFSEQSNLKKLRDKRLLPKQLFGIEIDWERSMSDNPPLSSGTSLLMHNNN